MSIDDSTWLLMNVDDTMCLTFGRATSVGSPIKLRSEDCTLKKSVVCRHEMIPVVPTAFIPPKFPCVSINPEAKLQRRKRSTLDRESRQNEKHKYQTFDGHEEEHGSRDAPKPSMLT